MKKHIALLLLSVGTLVGSANAQPGPGYGGRGGNGFYQDLPAETQDKLAALRGTHQAERTALTVQLRNGTLSRVDFQAKQAELTARHRAEMLALLTPEQRTAFEANQARSQARRTASRDAFMSTYFERMSTDMKLNAQKKASLKSLLDAHMAEMEPQRGQGRRGDFAERDDARAELDTKVKDLLSRDEYAIFRSYMDAHQRNAGPQQGPQQGQGPRQGRRGN
ncbi:MAG: hypothetical protein RL177_308 [Bacteroidota bacterium]